MACNSFIYKRGEIVGGSLMRMLPPRAFVCKWLPSYGRSALLAPDGSSARTPGATAAAAVSRRHKGPPPLSAEGQAGLPGEDGQEDQGVWRRQKMSSKQRSAIFPANDYAHPIIRRTIICTVRLPRARVPCRGGPSPHPRTNLRLRHTGNDSDALAMTRAVSLHRALAAHRRDAPTGRAATRMDMEQLWWRLVREELLGLSCFSRPARV